MTRTVTVVQRSKAMIAHDVANHMHMDAWETQVLRRLSWGALFAIAQRLMPGYEAYTQLPKDADC